MSYRFNKSYKVGGGFRVNVSKSGIGVSGGVKGFRVSTGPAGTRVTTRVPVTGQRIQKSIGSTKSSRKTESLSSTPKLPKAHMFASKREKLFVKGLRAFVKEDHDTALEHMRTIAAEETGAAVIAAVMLSDRAMLDGAIAYLERIIGGNYPLPSPLMKKYISEMALNIQITPMVTAYMLVTPLTIALLLAELYQRQKRHKDAIGLLEEIASVIDNPVLTLSLCELYSELELWDGIISRAHAVEVSDDITLSISILHGFALQNKGLHDGAISVFKEALRKRKDINPELRNVARYFRAISYESSGKRSQAKKEFQEVYAQNPNLFDIAERIKEYS